MSGPDAVARGMLRRAVAELRMVYDAARRDADELAAATATIADDPRGAPVELLRDTTGRYVFLDALTALTSALTALTAGEAQDTQLYDSSGLVGYEVTIRTSVEPGVHLFHPSEVRIVRRTP